MQYTRPYRFNLLISLLVALISVSLLTNCAREQSAEERDREKRDREIERLARAEGNYAGSLDTKSQQAIPFALVVSVSRNPEVQGDQPGLAARMRLGFFGGADLLTDAVSYDYGSKRLTASFAGSTAGKSLELQGYVSDSGLTDAKLVASSGSIYPLNAVTNKGLDLQEPSAELVYGLRITPSGDGKPVDAVLSLTRRTGDGEAPASSDMPRLPQIDGSLRFPGAASVAHTASSIQYDALEDTLDLYFPGGNGMRFAFSALSTIEASTNERTFLSMPNLSGIAELGSRTIGNVSVSPDQLSLIERTKTSGLPAKNYSGYLEYENGRRLPVVGNTTYMGSEGSSATATPFNRFPNIRLQVSVCLNRQAFGTKKLVLTSVDYLKSEATFQNELATGERLYARYSDAWQNIDTDIVDDPSGGGGVGTATSRMSLVASKETERLLSCADTGTASEVLERLMRADGVFEDDPIDDPFLTYEGYLTRGGAAAVPIGIAIFPSQNPGGGTDEPSLQVTARIGFFGGANIASEPAIFNWGSGRIIASFKRPTGAPLELRAILEPEALRDAVMIGPNLGQSVLVVKKGVPPYASEALDSAFNTAITSGSGPVDPSNALLSVLTLRSRSEGASAPANIDLPTLPSIDASLRIDGLGQTPQVGTRVLYDVLRGTIEVNFSDSSVLEFSNVFLEKTNDPVRPFKAFTGLTGRMLLGGQPVAAVRADDVTLGGRWTIQDLPYTIYVGTYKGGGSDHTLKALARVDYPGNAGRNTAEYPFQIFPNLHMTVTLCLGNSAFSRRNLELEAVDYLSRRLVFKNKDTDVRNALEVAFAPRWMKLAGEFRDTDGSSGDTRGSRIDLTAIPNSSSIDCTATLP